MTATPPVLSPSSILSLPSSHGAIVAVGEMFDALLKSVQFFFVFKNWAPEIAQLGIV
jgi:hypothetical protein